MVSEPISDLGVGVSLALRGVCLFDPAIPWDTTRTLCLHGRMFVTSHIGYVMSYIGYGRKFMALYM